jgi:hypothetical protein
MYASRGHNDLRLAFCRHQRLIYSSGAFLWVKIQFLISLHDSTDYCSCSFGSGAYVSLMSMPVIAFGEIEDVGRRIGMSFTIIAFGALAGPPISGAVNNATGGFKAVGYYAGMRPACIYK